MSSGETRGTHSGSTGSFFPRAKIGLRLRSAVAGKEVVERTNTRPHRDTIPVHETRKRAPLHRPRHVAARRKEVDPSATGKLRWIIPARVPVLCFRASPPAQMKKKRRKRFLRWPSSKQVDRQVSIIKVTDRILWRSLSSPSVGFWFLQFCANNCSNFFYFKLIFIRFLFEVSLGV